MSERWTVEQGDTIRDPYLIRNTDGETVAVVQWDEHMDSEPLENARQIVRAVNCHADVLAALKEYHNANRIHHDEEARLYEIGEKAIAKAEGREAQMPRTFIIAEAGSNHDLSLEKAFRMVRVAAEAGADACKFQYWSSPTRMAARRNAPEYLPVYSQYRVPEHWLAALRAECALAGVEFMCSTYLPEDVDTVGWHVKSMKIASFEANDPVHLVAHVPWLNAGRRVFVSLGLGATVDVIERHLTRHAAIGLDLGDLVNLMWCVSAYPAPHGELQLRRLWCCGSYALPLRGFSDHSPAEEVLTGALAVAAGATSIERHFRLDDTDRANPDAPHAMTPGGLKAYVERVRFAEAVVGDTQHSPQPSEAAMLPYRVTEARTS